METKNTNGSRSYEHDIIGWFEDISEKAGQVQTETLRRILDLNWGVEYLKKWLGDIDVRDMDASALESLYTSLVPLASHADLEPFINRIADGDTAPLLTQQPITLLSLRYALPFTSFFFTSSGMLGQHYYSISLSFQI
jgi:auxin responsive GH3 family protein